MSLPVYAQNLGDEPPKLAEELPKLNWDAAPKGPLLLVDATSISLTSPSPVSGSWTPQGLAAASGLKSASVGGLTVWVPTMMRTFPAPTRQPDATELIPFRERRLRLLVSLKESQRKALFSERGLGMEDINPDQARMLLSSLPDPIELNPYTPALRAGFVFRPRQISGDERAAIRLRVVRSPRTRLVFQVPELQKEEGPLIVLSSEPDLSILYNTPKQPTDTVLGSSLVRDVPNQPKASELNYAAPELDAPLSLQGAKTVGDLVARAAKLANAELYVDPRLARYSVHSVGASARVGDVLQALAYALTGTFRRVEGQAWVLTVDKEPILARLARRQAWAAPALAEASKLKEKRISWALPEVLSVGSLSGISAGKKPLAQLPPDVRSQVEAFRNRYDSPDYSASFNKIKLTAESFTPDTVQIEAPLVGELILPDGTLVRDATLRQIVSDLDPEQVEDEPPPPPKQVALKRPPILLLQADTQETARRLVRLAAERHLPNLWLAMPLSADIATEKAILSAALAEGKTKKVTVGALLHLLAATPNPEAMDRDERLTGGREPDQPSPYLPKTAFEWLAPDAPGVTAKVRARINELAGLPGLAGLALVDTAPPGYSPKPSFFSNSTRYDFGGRPGNRLAFLRRTGADPLDLDRGILFGPFHIGVVVPGVSLLAPNAHGPGVTVGPNSIHVATAATDEGKRLMKDWQQFLGARIDTLRQGLFPVVRSHSAALPLWIEQPAVGDLLSLAVWDKANQSFSTPAPQARTMRYIICAPGQYLSSWRPTPDGAEALARTVFTQADGVEQVLLDLQAIPLEDVSRWLEGVSFPAAP
ncbi:MAG: hypothetical protein QM758_01065 [Armatimonas sp.]